MDWSRAKTILIIIFLALNIFLLYNVAKEETRALVVTQKDIDDIRLILQKNNIDLKASLPSKIKPRAFLKIEDIAYKEQDLVNKFFRDTNGVVKTSNNGIERFARGSEAIELHPDRKFIYTNNPSDNIEGYSKNKVIRYVEDYFNKHGIAAQYGIVDKFEQTKEGYEITYKEEYKGNQIFPSYIKVNLSNKGITRIERLWFNPIQFVDAAKDIKTPTEILLVFAKDLGNKEKVSVNNISVGYYFPDVDYKNASISAIPVWKIEVSNGQIYYYNAYDGYLER